MPPSHGFSTTIRFKPSPPEPDFVNVTGGVWRRLHAEVVKLRAMVGQLRSEAHELNVLLAAYRAQTDRAERRLDQALNMGDRLVVPLATCK